MNSILLGVGANLSPAENISRALVLLQHQVQVVASSTFYRTAPLGHPEQPAYRNGAWLIHTTRSPRELKFDVLRAVEAALGRVRGPDRHAPRPIDLDIALFGDMVLQEADLRIPDPELYERAFLAAPLSELAPGLILPDTGQALADLAVSKPTRDMEPDEVLTRNLREAIERAADERTES